MPEMLHDLFEPMMGLDNVTMAPHVGSSTVSTRRKMAFMVIDGMLEALSGNKPENIVNPTVFKGSKGV